MTLTEGALKVAVVGAGPAGLYVADFLTDAGQAQVDVFERLPVPFGLLRYGVAPDHLNIKSAGRVLRDVLERPGVRLFANVEVGRDVLVEELRERYHAVVYALGASKDRALGIPGEDLPGSVSATAFVNWYNGHPEGDAPQVLGATAVAVIGVGNVAVDVARILLKDTAALTHTDMPQPVLEALQASSVADVHVLGRRDAVFAKFTSKELKELGELPGVDVLVDGAVADEAPDDAAPAVKRNLALLRGWAERGAGESPKRLHLHFCAKPEEVLGTSHVSGLRVRRTLPDGTGTDQVWELPVQAVLRSVGYQGRPFEGVPFDEGSSMIPSVDSRVVRDGVPHPGEYVVGWIRRGPVGVLGTNRSDAEDAVARIAEDREVLLARPIASDDLGELLARRGARPVDLAGWLAVLDREDSEGAPHGRGTVKLVAWGDLLEAAGLAAGSEGGA